MGELHLEITVYRIEEEQNIKVQVSPPIVVYREGLESNNKGNAFEGKSPNRHNRFFIEVEPLSPEVVDALRDGHFGDGTVRDKDSKATGDKFAEFGMNKDLMRKCFGSSWRSKIQLEKDLMASLHHPFLVNLQYAFQNPDFLALVMDLVPAGDLSEFVLTEKRLTSAQVRRGEIPCRFPLPRSSLSSIDRGRFPRVPSPSVRALTETSG